MDVSHDIHGPDCLKVIKNFENGRYNNSDIVSQHSNIVRGVIIGKKSWGLWLNTWTDGIVEGSFTKHEILQEFENKGIRIPQSLRDDFDNRIFTKNIGVLRKC